MTKRYSSFEEIDVRLKVLKLQREIDAESLKLHFKWAKTSFYPTRLMGGFSSTIQKIVLAFVLKKLLRTFRKSKPKEISE